MKKLSKKVQKATQLSTNDIFWMPNGTEHKIIYNSTREFSNQVWLIKLYANYYIVPFVGDNYEEDKEPYTIVQTDKLLQDHENPDNVKENVNIKEFKKRANRKLKEIIFKEEVEKIRNENI